MKFNYKRFNETIIRPVIPIEIVRDDLVVRYEVLVDSGADCNIVPAEIGELLGIDILEGLESEVGGISGKREPYYIHTVTIRIGGWDHEVEMGFMPNMSSFGYGVVGQRGFFNIFRVQFDHRKEEIELKPHIV
jgi:hypothetical protein